MYQGFKNVNFTEYFAYILNGWCLAEMGRCFEGLIFRRTRKNFFLVISCIYVRYLKWINNPDFLSVFCRCSLRINLRLHGLVDIWRYNQSTNYEGNWVWKYLLVLYLVGLSQEKQVSFEYAFEIAKHFWKCALIK